VFAQVCFIHFDQAQYRLLQLSQEQYEQRELIPIHCIVVLAILILSILASLGFYGGIMVGIYAVSTTCGGKS
jgi:hypothetical protein